VLSEKEWAKLGPLELFEFCLVKHSLPLISIDQAKEFLEGA
jgi:hypothetical protein